MVFVIHGPMLALANNCMAEICVYMPVSGGFVRMADNWVDDAFGFMAGWNRKSAFCLLLMVFSFTFITSPWSDGTLKTTPFATGITQGHSPHTVAMVISGRFEGFLTALWSATFTFVGPEYISPIEAEARHPRRYLKNACSMIYWCFCFYVGSALVVAIVVAVGSAMETIGKVVAFRYIVSMLLRTCFW